MKIYHSNPISNDSTTNEEVTKGYEEGSCGVMKSYGLWRFMGVMQGYVGLWRVIKGYEGLWRVMKGYGVLWRDMKGCEGL